MHVVVLFYRNECAFAIGHLQRYWDIILPTCMITHIIHNYLPLMHNYIASLTKSYIVYVVWQVRVTAGKDAVTIETFSITAELIFTAKNIKLHGFIYFRFEWTKFVTFYWHGLQRFYRSARNEQVWIPQAFSTCERFIWKLFIFWIRWFHGRVLLSAVEGTRN